MNDIDHGWWNIHTRIMMMMMMMIHTTRSLHYRPLELGSCWNHRSSTLGVLLGQILVQAESVFVFTYTYIHNNEDLIRSMKLALKIKIKQGVKAYPSFASQVQSRSTNPVHTYIHIYIRKKEKRVRSTSGTLWSINKGSMRKLRRTICIPRWSSR
jgi:hypothetical protein